MIAIPNMEKPKSCWECVKSLDIECCGDIRNCPIIEISDIQYKAFLEFSEKLMKKLEEHFLYGERRTDE